MTIRVRFGSHQTRGFHFIAAASRNSALITKFDNKVLSVLEAGAYFQSAICGGEGLGSSAEGGKDSGPRVRNAGVVWSDGLGPQQRLKSFGRIAESILREPKI